ncbi:MAG: SDR family oxidoreductase [Pseudomonadota bacterium]
MDLGYKGKTVIVTGGGSNIGRGISLAFAKEGANLMIGDIDTAQAEKVVQEANAFKGGGKTTTTKCDVTNLDDVQAMFKKANDELGQIDVLVNNVGWGNVVLFTETTPDVWEKEVKINYISVLNCTKTALDYMIAAKKGGAIVSISSDASRQGEYKAAVYGGVKAAVNGFMKSVARENGRFGIRTNVVCPGATIPSQDEIGDMSGWKNSDAMFTPEKIQKLSMAYPLRKIGKATDIANAVLFLASNEVAGHITGQILSVSGGWSMVG